MIDDIVDRVQRCAEELQWVVAREQLFKGEDRPLRPDLVIKTPGKAIVVDVTVRFEQEESLAEAAAEKSRKYKDILQSVMRDMDVRAAEVMPLVFGSRGGFPRATAKNL